MGRELLSTYPRFNEVVLECERWLSSNGYPSALDIIAGGNDGDSMVSSKALAQQSTQTAVFVLEVALARLLISLGITPTTVLGHRYVCRKYRILTVYL